MLLKLKTDFKLRTGAYRFLNKRKEVFFFLQLQRYIRATINSLAALTFVLPLFSVSSMFSKGGKLKANFNKFKMQDENFTNVVVINGCICSTKWKENFRSVKMST